MGHAWEATGGKGFGNYWDTLGGQREAMDLVTFWDTLGKQREAMNLVTFGLGTRLGGNGRQWIW